MQEAPTDGRPHAAIPPLRISCLLWIALLASYLSTGVYGPDLFRHLLFGRWILHHGFPRENIWSVAGYGEPLAYSSWLLSVVLSGAETWLGEQGLAMAELLSSFLFVGTLLFACAALSGSIFRAACISALAVSGVMIACAFDGGMFGYALLSLLLFLAVRLPSAGAKALVLFFAAGVLHANLHASSALGTLIAAAIVLSRMNAPGASRKKALIAFVILAVSQLLTPYAGGQFLYELRRLAESLLVAVQFRGQAATLFNYSTGFLLLLLVLIASSSKSIRTQMRAGDLACLGALSVLSFIYSPLTPFALITAALFLSELLGRAGDTYPGGAMEAADRLGIRLRKLPAAGVLWVLLCAAIVNILHVWFFPVRDALMPSREIDYLAGESLQRSVLHEQPIGSYFAHRFSNSDGMPGYLAAAVPWARVSAGAAPVSSAKDPDNSGSGREKSAKESFELGAAGLHLERLGPGWEQFFELVNPRSVVCRRATPLYELLLRDSSWRLAYDGEEVVGSGHRRKTGPGWTVFRKNVSAHEGHP